MKKILISLSLISILLLGMGSTVLATNQDFKFIVSSGGSSDYSYATTKSDTDLLWYMTPKQTSPSYPGVSSTWHIGETIRMRVRDDINRSPYSPAYNLTRRSASTLPTSTTGAYDVTEARAYNSGADLNSMKNKKFRLYADKASSDSFGTLTLVGTWCP